MNRWGRPWGCVFSLCLVPEVFNLGFITWVGVDRTRSLNHRLVATGNLVLDPDRLRSHHNQLAELWLVTWALVYSRSRCWFFYSWIFYFVSTYLVINIQANKTSSYSVIVSTLFDQEQKSRSEYTTTTGFELVFSEGQQFLPQKNSFWQSTTVFFHCLEDARQWIIFVFWQQGKNTRLQITS